jgi:hypothetical protein
MFGSLVLVLVGSLAAPANAHIQTKIDGDDVRGPLDIASVAVEHDESDLLFTITTHRGWKLTDLGPSSFFLLLIDRDQDGSFDRCAFIFSQGGQLRSSLTRCGRREIGNPPVSKPTRRSATVGIATATADGTHDWAILSRYDESLGCSRPCLDLVPNRRPMLHDIEPPEVAWVTTTSGSMLSTQLSSTTTVPVEFTSFDTHTGVVARGIQRAVVGGWEDLATGLPLDTDTHDLVLNEGETYLLRPVATDAHENLGFDPATLVIRVPFDDAHADVGYAGTWTSVADGGSFQAGVHSSSSVGASMTFTFTLGEFGGTLRILGGPADGTASVEVDGDFGGNALETPSTPKSQNVYGQVWATPGTHTVTLTVTSGTFVIDGIAVYG